MDEEINKWISSLLHLWQGCEGNKRQPLATFTPN